MTINKDEIYDPILVDEEELETVIQLNEDRRCIACDCTVLEDDIYITLKRKDLPVDYLKFCRDMDKYKYINNQFVYSPVEQEPTFEEKVIAEQERQGQALEELISIIMGGM